MSGTYLINELQGRIEFVYQFIDAYKYYFLEKAGFTKHKTLYEYDLLLEGTSDKERRKIIQASVSLQKTKINESGRIGEFKEFYEIAEHFGDILYGGERDSGVRRYGPEIRLNEVVDRLRQLYIFYQQSI